MADGAETVDKDCVEAEFIFIFALRLLRGRNLPGTVRVSRREPDLVSSIPDNSHQQEALHEPEFATNGGTEESSPNPELVQYYTR